MYFAVPTYQPYPLLFTPCSNPSLTQTGVMNPGACMNQESFLPGYQPYNPQAQSGAQMLGLGLALGMMMGMMNGGMLGMGGFGGFPGMGGMGMINPQSLLLMMMLMQAAQQNPQLFNGLPQGVPNSGGNFGGPYGQLPYSPFTNSPSGPAFPPTFGGNRANQALYAATSQLGVTGASNPYQVSQYSQGRSEAWCADFVSWCYERTPGGSPFGHRPGVASIHDWGNQQHLYHDRGTYQARPGDVIIFGNDQHVGIVERVDPDGTVHTIEGNSPGYGVQSGRSAYQGAVARHTLNPNSSWIRGYVDMQQYQ